MKPFYQEISIVEYYKNSLKTVEKENNIFSDLHQFKLNFDMNMQSLLMEILNEKKIPFCLYADVVELIDVKRSKSFFQRNKCLNYADVRPSHTLFKSEYSDLCYTINVYNKDYMKFCERISRMLIDFANVTINYQGPLDYDLNSKDTIKERTKSKKKYIFYNV